MTENEIREKIRELQDKINKINSTTQIKQYLGDQIANWEEEKKKYEAALEFCGCVNDFKRINEKARTYLDSLDKRIAELDLKYADSKRKFNKDIIAACNKLKK